MLALIMVLILLPIFNFLTKDVPNWYSTAFFFMIMTPTLMTLVNGAPFVPTPMEAVRKMLKLANIKKGEVVYDIGCGDGRMVYLAVKECGAKGTGFELSPFVYLLAIIRKLFWRSKARILFRNFKTQSFKDADVIMCYLMPETLDKLRPKLESELKKGARIISYAFRIKDWKEKHREEKDLDNNISPIWIYIKE